MFYPPSPHLIRASVRSWRWASPNEAPPLSPPAAPPLEPPQDPKAAPCEGEVSSASSPARSTAAAGSGKGCGEDDGIGGMGGASPLLRMGTSASSRTTLRAWMAFKLTYRTTCQGGQLSVDNSH